MTSHLTVSVELISFMKWILKHKKTEFSQLIKTSLQEGLRNEIMSVTHRQQDVSTEDLYEVVNTFLAFIEDDIVDEMTKKYMHHTHTHERPTPSTSTPLNTQSLYKSLTPTTQAQLQSMVGGNAPEILSHSIEEAAHQLNGSVDGNSEQAKRLAVMRAVLNNWAPEKDSEVN